MKLENIRNFGKLFIEAMDNYGERDFLQWKDGDLYKGLTGFELKKMVNDATNALETFNLRPFDKAAIISENRYEWVVADFACIFNRIVTVPIYTTMTAEQTRYILRHSESKICFVSNQMLMDKVVSVMGNLPDLKKIVCYNTVKRARADVVMFEELIRARDASLPLSMTGENEYLKNKAEKINEGDLMTIIYTSGTTGVPKGVCLSHKNILSNIKSCHNAFHVDEKDVFLSFLPLAHSYERTAGYYFPLSVRAKIVYAQNIDTLARQMSEVKPTIVTTVPLLFSKIQSKIEKALERYGFLKGLFRIIAFRKLRQRLGGRLRFFVSGGSALNKDTGEFFDAAGIKILEGYGMTEASPVISANREDNYKFGTVGFPLDGVTVKIAEDGEIVVKGDNVMNGYYKDDDETRKTIIDGWLHTGDIGEFDSGGMLKITDRKKTLYKTAGGKYISLTHIEDTISRSKYIDQIIAFGGDRMFVSALVVPDFEELKGYADKNSINYQNNEQLIDDPRIKKLIESDISVYQQDLAKYERVRKFKMLPNPFTIESGELTPTLKLKRKVIEEKYKDELEKMYELR